MISTFFGTANLLKNLENQVTNINGLPENNIELGKIGRDLNNLSQGNDINLTA